MPARRAQLQALLERGACVEYEEVQQARRRRGARRCRRGRPAPSTRADLVRRFERQVGLDELLARAGLEAGKRAEADNVAERIGASATASSPRSSATPTRRSSSPFARTTGGTRCTR
ncbi:MAG: hypothetical protein U1F67_06470 [Rubrivivax sp.]